MIQHTECNTEVRSKITSDGELYFCCPVCKIIWKGNMEVFYSPGLTLDIPAGKVRGIEIKSSRQEVGESDEFVAMARDLFPDIL